MKPAFVNWLWRHGPLTLTVIVAIGMQVWAYVQDSETLIAISANVWGIVVLLLVMDVTPRSAKEKQEQR